jgi:hypothetical protein
MSLTIHCYEPQSVPRAASLSFDKPHPFAVYALQDNLSEDTRDLRSTVMRRIEENPPPGSTLLFELDIRASRPGELPTLKVMKVGARAMIEIVRSDSRGRVTKGTDLKSGSRFEATLRDLRTIVFNLEIESEAVREKGGIASARPSGSKAVAGVTSLIWVVPTVLETIAEPRAKLVAWLVKQAQRMGISRSLISPMLLMSAMFIGLGYVAYTFYQDGMSAQDRLDSLEVDLINSQAATTAALSAEMECRAHRKVLTKALDQIDETRKLQAELALSPTLARAVSIEEGGARMASEPLIEFDTVAAAGVQKLVVAQMAAADKPGGLPRVCLAQENALGQDLPKFVLVWHPSPDFICPNDYQVVLDGVDIAGPWGLSKRVQREFGEAATVPEGTDVRTNERWAANTYTAALRHILSAMVGAETGERPPVAPQQVHLWTLALFDAYNRMPSPAEGSMDRPVEECVVELIDELSRRFGPAEPGQPVLPSIDRVALGDQIKVTPTSGCPWPADALSHGTQAALRAVTTMAVLQQAIDDGEIGGEEEG